MPVVCYEIPLWQAGTVRCSCTIVSRNLIRVAVTVDGTAVRDLWSGNFRDAGACAAGLIHEYLTQDCVIDLRERTTP